MILNMVFPMEPITLLKRRYSGPRFPLGRHSKPKLATLGRAHYWKLDPCVSGNGIISGSLTDRPADFRAHNLLECTDHMIFMVRGFQQVMSPVIEETISKALISVAKDRAQRRQQEVSPTLQLEYYPDPGALKR